VQVDKIHITTSKKIACKKGWQDEIKSTLGSVKVDNVLQDFKTLFGITKTPV